MIGARATLEQRRACANFMIFAQTIFARKCGVF
jgi:hypothetical protein